MTDEELDAIEARANAASKGPWRVDRKEAPGQVTHEYVRGPSVTISSCCGCNDEGPVWREWVADRRFIAHARTDVPALVAEVRRLRAAEAAREHQCAEAQALADMFEAK